MNLVPWKEKVEIFKIPMWFQWLRQDPILFSFFSRELYISRHFHKLNQKRIELNFSVLAVYPWVAGTVKCERNKRWSEDSSILHTQQSKACVSYNGLSVMPARTECPSHGFNFLPWSELVSGVLFLGTVLNCRKDILVDKNTISMHIPTWTLSEPVHLCGHVINICLRAVQTHSKSCLLRENDL